MSKKDSEENKKKENDFLDDFEDWHSRQYSDEYRFRNKTPFFIKKTNYLVHGILLLTLPSLSLIISAIVDLGVGFYIFFLLMCIPGSYLIIKHFKSR